MARQFGLEGIPHFKIYDPSGKPYKEGFEIYKEILKGLKAKSSKVQTIVKDGRKFEPKKFLAKDKVTVFYFYADW